MRIVIITQDEPFFLGRHFDHFFRNIPNYANVVGCVVFPPSTHGRRKSFVFKSLDTLKRFGIKFFVFYSIKYIISKLNKSKSVFRILEKNKINTIILNQSINNKKSLKVLKELEPDLLISVLGNEIFKTELINLAKHGCLNLHTSLLPKYRGVMPTFWVLRYNEEETGVSVFFVDEGIDTGPILVQKRIKVENRTQYQLIEHTKKIGMDAIIESIELINKGNYELIPNEDRNSSYYSLPKKEDVKEFYKNGKRFF